MFSILFAGLTAASISRDAEEQRRIQNVDMTQGDIYFLATVSLSLVGFPRRPSLYAHAAYILSQSQLVREEEFGEAPTFISTAFRVSLAMGLHRDSSYFGLGKAESEVRRRLWWHVIHLDVMASASSGLSPLFIDDKMANASSTFSFTFPAVG